MAAEGAVGAEKAEEGSELAVASLETVAGGMEGETCKNREDDPRTGSAPCLDRVCRGVSSSPKMNMVRGVRACVGIRDRARARVRVRSMRARRWARGSRRRSTRRWRRRWSHRWRWCEGRSLRTRRWRVARRGRWWVFGAWRRRVARRGRRRGLGTWRWWRIGRWRRGRWRRRWRRRRQRGRRMVYDDCYVRMLDKNSLLSEAQFVAALLKVQRHGNCKSV